MGEAGGAIKTNKENYCCPRQSYLTVRGKTFFAPSAVMELSPQSHYKNFPSVHLGDQIVFGRETSECFSTIIHDVQSTLNISHVFLGLKNREIKRLPTCFTSFIFLF